MADLLDITNVELSSSLDAAMSARAFSRARMASGGQQVAPTPMLWNSSLPQIAAPHQETALTPDIETFFVEDVTVGGYGAHLVRNEHIIYAEGAYPRYVKMYVDEDINPQYWLPKGEVTSELPRAIIMTHFNIVYGHWLLEMFPKIFAVRKLEEAGVIAPLLFAADVPKYVLAVVANMLPRHPIVLFERDREMVFVRQAIIPSMLQREYIFHSLFTEALDNMLAEQAGRRRWPNAIFISRSKLTHGSYRSMTNAAEIEKLSARLGLTVIHPEELDWFDQVQLFSGARLIVGEFGSGLHNALFAPGEARVVSLNWIVDVQSRIANMRGQQVGYILPSDGKPRGFSLDEQDADATRYHIDPEEFASRVKPLVRESRPRWGARA